jgi:hypothetical protein
MRSPCSPGPAYWLCVVVHRENHALSRIRLRWMPYIFVRQTSSPSLVTRARAGFPICCGVAPGIHLGRVCPAAHVVFIVLERCTLHTASKEICHVCRTSAAPVMPSLISTQSSTRFADGDGSGRRRVSGQGFVPHRYLAPQRSPTPSVQCDLTVNIAHPLRQYAYLPCTSKQNRLASDAAQTYRS